MSGTTFLQTNKCGTVLVEYESLFNLCQFRFYRTDFGWTSRSKLNQNLVWTSVENSFWTLDRCWNKDASSPATNDILVPS
ncbi:hypothetical protein RRG08_008762 [Elysia crispata]|uniref:Uncharacterized protein n=1 Tax=Elysia crispata TaxID=231223 RepID=A0AAE1CN93_9GAST|nr:hypothetical protein RRG08_008762 [Elysia crispata]